MAAPPPPPSPTHTQCDVEYLTAFGATFKLDVIEPDTDDVLPLAVIIHGGSFIGGDKNQNEVFAVDWASRGYRT